MASPTAQPISDLATTLVQIAYERGISVERSRAEQLLAEARHAWPGEPARMWPQWLAECATSVGLRTRVAELPATEAFDLVEDGALLVGSPSPDETTLMLLDCKGSRVTIVNPESDRRQRITRSELANSIQASYDLDENAAVGQPYWLIVEDLELSHEPSQTFHHRPIARLLAILRPEWSDIWVVAVFAFFTGVLSLATPIAVESLVNIVAFGRLLQPLVILSLMLFGFLAFASLMRALQTFVVEIIQRRLFVRVAADLAYRFPRVSQASLTGHYGPELANRFFDIVTLQKVVAKLLLDGLAIILATFVGMAVLAFYHPWLLGFDVLLLLLVVVGVLVLGRGAISSGIDESKQKYRLAAWLQDVIRCPIGFKEAGATEFALDRANQITADYLNARRRHFRVLFGQLLFIMGLQAVAGTVLLGFGGWLVIRGQLTLGQLVAAELIVATILSSLAKLGKHIESFYDVVAAVDKLGHLFDLEIEPQDGLLALQSEGGVRLRITEVKHSVAAPSFSLEVEAGERVALLCPESAGSTVLFGMLYGLRTPEAGHLEIEHTDPRDLRLDVLRDTVALVRGVEIFEGTVAENVQLARPEVSMTDLRAALYGVGLLDEVLRLSNGLDTQLHAGTGPLNATQLQLLMLARAVAGQPQLLMIDGTLDYLGDAQLDQVCEMLDEEAREWTLLVATNRRDIAERFARVVDLEPAPDSAPPHHVAASPDPEPTA